MGMVCYPCGETYNIQGQNLSARSGPHIEYQLVETLLGDNGENGKIIEEFTVSSDIGSTNFPFASPVHMGWKGAKPKTAEHYKNVNNNYQLVKKEEFSYQSITGESSEFLQNLKIGKNESDPCEPVCFGNCSGVTSSVLSTAISKYSVEFTSLFTEYFHLQKKTETIYSSNNTLTPSVITQKEYVYDGTNQNLLSKIVTQTSKGETNIVFFLYPQDIVLAGEQETARQQMLNENKLAIVLEQRIERDGEIIKKERVNYKVFGDKTLPESIDEQIGNNPIEKRLKYYLYDNLGNILEQSKVDDAHTSIVWGYNHQYPVAEITNATYDQVKAALGISGVNDINLGTGGLTDAQKTALRTNLPQALITIYDYIPLVGMVSATDSNGVRTTYEYDEFQRLRFIKDRDGNILKEYNYHYKGQPK